MRLGTSIVPILPGLKSFDSSLIDSPLIIKRIDYRNLDNRDFPVRGDRQG
jgi:hypothetical protein